MQTIFIALQCCQCSTMQVKQKKKCSNKWTCVVCNQKQSVRKVFAQGYMAKDLRKFVQSFNMSRKLADEQDCLDQEGHAQISQIDDTDFNEDCRQRKRRTDWTEYLDAKEDYNVKSEDEGEEIGPMIVTELPKEMFKRPKLRNCELGSLPGDGEDDRDGEDRSLYKPVFSKRNANKFAMSQDKRKYQSMQPAGASKWSNYKTNDGGEARTFQSAMGKTKASKWSDYITQDEADVNVVRGRNFANHSAQQSYDGWETILDDAEKVEDDVHPDFM